MKQYYVPYSGELPASLSINGHQLVIVSEDRDELLDGLSQLGADRVEGIVSSGEDEEEVELAKNLAQCSGSGVVIAPAELTLDELIQNLEIELPWIQ